ncbi:Hypothetical predicted protein [Marmota monax]|uniref:Uncharacterized protein n=1 Tax=Marmota monax TaxID=9995 RepID=A0A5E4BNG6_MARMO|nr:Hypothetical predicted protein [Marmota monax]
MTAPSTLISQSPKEKDKPAALQKPSPPEAEVTKTSTQCGGTADGSSWAAFKKNSAGRSWAHGRSEAGAESAGDLATAPRASGARRSSPTQTPGRPSSRPEVSTPRPSMDVQDSSNTAPPRSP